MTANQQRGDWREDSHTARVDRRLAEHPDLIEQLPDLAAPDVAHDAAPRIAEHTLGELAAGQVWDRFSFEHTARAVIDQLNRKKVRGFNQRRPHLCGPLYATTVYLVTELSDLALQDVDRGPIPLEAWLNATTRNQAADRLRAFQHYLALCEQNGIRMINADSFRRDLDQGLSQIHRHWPKN